MNHEPVISPANRPILVECPRDAMQGWSRLIPAQEKVRYLNSLLRVGFDTLDFGSFVSPKAIPQMADTAEVLEELDLSGSRTSLLAIVGNLRGAEAAVGFEQIGMLGFPFSISPTFQQRNTNSTMEESLQRVDAIQERCLQKNRQLVIYLSMGFGNPYGDPYHEELLLHWAGQMVEKGIGIISLADTVGLASPVQISAALKTLIAQYPDTVFGVHLHASPHNWYAKLEAAWLAGCRRFDGALNGIGGCPMAQDELVGNLDTNHLISFLREKGLDDTINNAALQESLRIASEIFV